MISFFRLYNVQVLISGLVSVVWYSSVTTVKLITIFSFSFLFFLRLFSSIFEDMVAPSLLWEDYITVKKLLIFQNYNGVTNLIFNFRSNNNIILIMEPALQAVFGHSSPPGYYPYSLQPDHLCALVHVIGGNPNRYSLLTEPRI